MIKFLNYLNQKSGFIRIFIFLFSCLVINNIYSHPLAQQISQDIPNTQIPDLNSKKWVSFLSDVMIAYSNAKSEEEIQEVDEIFRGILAGKYATNILFLESLRNELKKDSVSQEEIDRKVRKIFEDVLLKASLMVASEENRQYLYEKLGSVSNLQEKEFYNPPCVQDIKNKIIHKYKNHELVLVDPDGKEVTDINQIQNVLENINIAIGIPSYKEGENIRNSVEKMFSGLKEYFNKEQIVLLANFYHAVKGNTRDAFQQTIQELISQNPKTNIYSLVMSTGLDTSGNPIKGKGNNFRNFFEILYLAKNTGNFKGGACVDADLRTVVNNGEEEGISELWVKNLIYPIVYPEEFGLKKAAQFVSPLYSRHEYDGGMTNNCCMGWIRLASDRTIRQPIGGDFGLSGDAIEKFLFNMEWNYETTQYGIDIAMSLTAALNQLNVVEADLGVKIHDSSEGKAFLIGKEVFGSAVKLLTHKKEKWAHIQKGDPILRVAEKRKIIPQPLFVDYEFYKKEFFTFFKKPFLETNLAKDLLTKEEIISKTEEWGLKKDQINQFFDNKTHAEFVNLIIQPYVLKRLEQLKDTEDNQQVKLSWMRLFQDRKSTFLQNVKILYNLAGLETTCKALDVLIGIGIDVSNPWIATRYFLEMIIWGNMLFGKDIEPLKYFFINHENHYLDAHFPFNPILVPELTDTMSLAVLREKYETLQEDLAKLVVSSGNYQEIDHEVRRAINEFFKRIIKILVHRVWNELNISLNSSALCYFREVKTFVSDLDLIYVGPFQEKVDARLTSIMFALGIKRDIFAIDMMLADAMNPASSNFIGGQYYRNIETVEFNMNFDQFFNEHFYKKDLLDCIDINNYKAHQVLTRWQNTLFQDADTKEIYYVGVNHLLRGLALKYSIPCGPYNEDFWKELGKYLKPEETLILSEANSIANQIRNLYQLAIARRSWILFVRTDVEWLKLKSQIAQNIEEVFTKQGLPNLKQHLAHLRDKLEIIRDFYLGPAKSAVELVGVDLPEIKSNYWYDLNRHVNDAYLLMTHNRFGFDPLKSIN
jgi:hypothetical protein